MHPIFLDFTISSPLGQVFSCVSQPEELSKWWTKETVGEPTVGARYILNFGPGFKWEAVVSKFAKNEEFELLIEIAQKDWVGTRVGFRLSELGNKTKVQFYHLHWPELNEHFRTSCYCWAMYLRILKQYLENGFSVAYEQRLEA